jgi:hypothetical protein
MHTFFFICGIVGGCNIIRIALTRVLSTMLDGGKEGISEATTALDEMVQTFICLSVNFFHITELKKGGIKLN